MYEYNTNLIKRDSEFKYYFLGFVAADGWISDKSNRIEITLKSSDECILKIFRDMICPGKHIGDKQIKLYDKYYHAKKLTFDNKEIKNMVMSYLNTTNKTSSLIFPYGIPDAYLKDFIRGYIDGDGTIGIAKRVKLVDNKEQFYYGPRLRVIGTRAFLQGLHINLKRILDLKNNVNPHKKGIENVYVIEYAFNAANKIYNILYDNSTYFLPRKKQVFHKIVTSDTSELAINYDKESGKYNMQSTNNISEGIVE